MIEKTLKSIYTELVTLIPLPGNYSNHLNTAHLNTGSILIPDSMSCLYAKSMVIV